MSILAEWTHPVVIAPNNFVYKSLSNWACNTAVGCGHGCRFCYVPSVSTNKLGKALKGYGVENPDSQWGEYVFPRQWDEAAFRRSLLKAELTHAEDLKRDGNRAVMFCSTTDAYQVLKSSVTYKRIEAQARLDENVTRALELILNESTLNVRILTRSPLARRDFGLMRKFGNRLLFGMSIPTLDNKAAQVFETDAPAPTVRLETLKRAKDAGLNVFVAMAPTYPYDPNDGKTRHMFREEAAKMLSEFMKLQPVTIFHEPINIRSENVARIKSSAERLKRSFDFSVFDNQEAWAIYAMSALHDVEDMARKEGAYSILHLWPDKSLIKYWKLPEQIAWVQHWWNRISEWPHAPAGVGDRF